MNSVPVHLYGVVIGQALVDSTLGLDERWKWKLEIPQSMYKAKHTADVLVAMLREDPVVLSRCHPVITIATQTYPYIVKLSKIVLRPETVAFMNELILHPRSNPRRERLEYDITHTLKSIHRVIHLNSNRVDCRRENLTELEVEPPTVDDNVF